MKEKYIALDLRLALFSIHSVPVLLPEKEKKKKKKKKEDEKTQALL